MGTTPSLRSGLLKAAAPQLRKTADLEIVTLRIWGYSRNMFKSNSKSRKHDRRTPLKAPPLRAPGESLRREIDDVLREKGNDWAVIVGLGWTFCAAEWIQWLLQTPMTLGNNIIVSVLAIVVTVVAIIKVRGIARQMRSIRQGMEGEQVVGQFLEEFCRPMNYKVFHDLVGDHFNVDHILVGPGGIYVLETKTISKPVVGSPVVTYEGQTVTIDGHTPDRDPIAQAKAEVNYVRQLLTECTGRKNIPVRPVVLYPGWYIEGSQAGKEVWVLEPKALPSFLGRESVKLSSEDIHLFAARLAEHIRAGERAAATK